LVVGVDTSLSPSMVTGLVRAAWWLLHSSLGALVRHQRRLPLAAQLLCCDALQVRISAA